jgi:hypothetical protein
MLELIIGWSLVVAAFFLGWIAATSTLTAKFRDERGKIAKQHAYAVADLRMAAYSANKTCLDRIGKILEDAPELNISNYTHDQVSELNAKMIEATLECRRERVRQSFGRGTAVPEGHRCPECASRDGEAHLTTCSEPKTVPIGQGCAACGTAGAGGCGEGTMFIMRGGYGGNAGTGGHA